MRTLRRNLGSGREPPLYKDKQRYELNTLQIKHQQNTKAKSLKDGEVFDTPRG